MLCVLAGEVLMCYVLALLMMGVEAFLPEIDINFSWSIFAGNWHKLLFKVNKVPSQIEHKNHSESYFFQ